MGQKEQRCFLLPRIKMGYLLFPPMASYFEWVEKSSNACRPLLRLVTFVLFNNQRPHNDNENKTQVHSIPPICQVLSYVLYYLI